MGFQVRVTDPTWLEHLNSIEKLSKANFWANRPYKDIGERIIFVKKGKKPRQIAGWGTLESFGEMSDGTGDWDAMDRSGHKSKDPASRVNNFDKYMILSNIVLLTDLEIMEDDVFNSENGYEPFSKVTGPSKTYHQDFPLLLERPDSSSLLSESNELGVFEGGYKYVYHKRLERNTSKLKKQMIREMLAQHNGALPCAGCDLNMMAYGFDEPIVDCHHLVPLSTFAGESQEVTQADLVLLCPNCHRAIHRQEDCSDLAALREKTASIYTK